MNRNIKQHFRDHHHSQHVMCLFFFSSVLTCHSNEVEFTGGASVSPDFCIHRCRTSMQVLQPHVELDLAQPEPPEGNWEGREHFPRPQNVLKGIEMLFQHNITYFRAWVFPSKQEHRHQKSTAFPREAFEESHCIWSRVFFISVEVIDNSIIGNNYYFTMNSMMATKFKKNPRKLACFLG